MVVDGKVFIGKEAIDSEINRIDLIGPDMKKVRDKERIKDITKKEIKEYHFCWEGICCPWCSICSY